MLELQKEQEKSISEDELKKINQIVLADFKASYVFDAKPELFKSVPDLLEEREELKRLLNDTRFKVLFHVAAAYREKISKINSRLDQLRKFAHLIALGYSPTLAYLKKHGGFINDPGRVIESPADEARGHRKGQVRIHHHSVYFRPIPLWVLEKYQTVKSLFNVCFIFSDQNNDLFGIVDQHTIEGGWENVKTLDMFRVMLKEKIKEMRYGDKKVSMVGFLPLQPDKDLEYEFSCYVDSFTIKVRNGIGFWIASWSPKKEMEKNCDKILVAQPTAS